MNTLCRWGGVARTSLDPPQEPHYGNEVEGSSTYKTKYRVANWAAYNQALVRRGDVTVWLSAEAIAAWTPGRERSAGWAAALLGSRHRDRPDSAAALPSPAAPGRRVPARPVRDDAPRPRSPRLYDALPAQSAFAALSATGPDRTRASTSCLTAQVCPSSGRVSGRPRNTVAAAGVAGGSFTLASISQA